MDDNLSDKTSEAIQEQTLLNKAIQVIEDNYPETGEYFLKEAGSDYLIVGFLTYYMEEAVLSEAGEFQGLTEDDIGEPCEYWEMTFSIEPDGSVVESHYGNYDPEDHPKWKQIIGVENEMEILTNGGSKHQ